MGSFIVQTHPLLSENFLKITNYLHRFPNVLDFKIKLFTNRDIIYTGISINEHTITSSTSLSSLHF